MSSTKTNVRIQPDPQRIRTREAAPLIGVSHQTMEKWRSSGIGPAYSRTPTGTVLYRINDLMAYADFDRVSTLHMSA